MGWQNYKLFHSLLNVSTVSSYSFSLQNLLINKLRVFNEGKCRKMTIDNFLYTKCCKWDSFFYTVGIELSLEKRCLQFLGHHLIQHVTGIKYADNYSMIVSSFLLLCNLGDCCPMVPMDFKHSWSYNGMISFMHLCIIFPKNISCIYEIMKEIHDFCETKNITT